MRIIYKRKKPSDTLSLVAMMARMSFMPATADAIERTWGINLPFALSNPSAEVDAELNSAFRVVFGRRKV